MPQSTKILQIKECQDIMAEAITLITNRICPFAQRAWLTLLEKNVQFTFKEASLTDKEAWFTEAYLKAYGHDSSSNGKVPILIHGDTVITESDLISWYVAESFPSGNELIPENRFQRLKMRRFIQQVPSKLITAFYSTKGFDKKTEEEKEQVLTKINDNLAIVEKQIVGPYVLGQEFSLADILLYPWLERWVVNQKFFGIALPENLVKIKAFFNAMQSRASVQKTLSEVPEELYLKGYEAYLKS